MKLRAPLKAVITNVVRALWERDVLEDGVLAEGPFADGGETFFDLDGFEVLAASETLTTQEL